MNWRHIQLIFHREMRDQLRDRRTLFTIAILPLLLYPLIGLLMMQIAQFNREYTVRIRVIGAENWPADLPLLDAERRLIPRLGSDDVGRLMTFETLPWPANAESSSQMLDDARTAVQFDETDGVLIVEPSFAVNLTSRLNPTRVANAGSDELQPASEASPDGHSTKTEPHVPADGLQLIANLSRDHSQLAQRRLERALDAWQQTWITKQLTNVGVNSRLVEPIEVAQTDTSPLSVRRAMLWSKVLPFVMLVWALTGAFYPAIDLCAGEKERGTLETLLSSPARRNEIVWGKLLTVAVFSICSALLNLFSMHLTAGLVVKQLASAGSSQMADALGGLPIHAFGWLVLLLLPMAAFFSALALAVAALARSTKEGQYYLMPLLLVTLPLVSLPMIPSLDLNLGTSLVPVSGAVFTVRSLIEGRYSEALIHLPVVIMVTTACCLLSIRWAIRQFESEAVMFREADRWNLQTWLKQLWRDRGLTASPTEAVLCGLIILVAMFFAQLMAGSTIADWGTVVRMTVAVQIGIILMPCLLMAIFLTRSLRSALRIHRTQWSHFIAAALLGVTLHPTYVTLGEAIKHVYGFGDQTQAVLLKFSEMVTAQPFWMVLLLLAVLPAICEELAFRGFIFGGLIKQGGALRAILVSALFFGFTHTVLQQSIAASIMGLILGLIAWRTGGAMCSILVHVVNNSLSIAIGWFPANEHILPSALQFFISAGTDGWSYQAAWKTISVGLTIALLAVLILRDSTTERTATLEAS
jgi:sodium transport system permease protein